MKPNRNTSELASQIAPMLAGKKITYAEPPTDNEDGNWLVLNFADRSTLYVEAPAYFYSKLGKSS